MPRPKMDCLVVMAVISHQGGCAGDVAYSSTTTVRLHDTQTLLNTSIPLTVSCLTFLHRIDRAESCIN